jgi:hypothetical protein
VEGRWVSGFSELVGGRLQVDHLPLADSLPGLALVQAGFSASVHGINGWIKQNGSGSSCRLSRAGSQSRCL